ncbi:DUF505 domain-containing protein [Hydrogenimonas sp.]
MVIKKEEAKHLLALLESPRREIDVSKLNEEGLRLLELAGLVHFPTPAFASLTYGGEGVARALRAAIEKGALEPVSGWDGAFRWIGSEILAMMENARVSGNVSELAVEPLKKRGLAHKIHDRERKVDLWVLTPEGESVLEAFETVEPDLKVDAKLAHAVLTAPVGPTEAVHMPFDDESKEALEAMRLLAYSVPRGDIAAFTGLGRAVRKVLEYGAAAPEGDVIDPVVMDLVAAVFDGEEVGEEAVAQLQMMGYIDDELALLPAGEALMELRALLKNASRRRLFTFALTQEMGETLQLLSGSEGMGVDEIEKEMVDRKVKEFKALKEKYGRRLDEMPLKKRQILEAFMEAKEQMAWFRSHFDIHEYLFALEAFDLAEAYRDESGKERFRATEWGHEVARELAKGFHTVSSGAVKTMELSRRPFAVPNREWVERAREEGILGEYGPGPRGEFYDALAHQIERKPFMTRYEMDVFKKVPEKGMTLRQLLESCADERERHMTEGAVDMLEARGLLEVLSDGHIVETEAGRWMDRALSGVPEGFGAPVTPSMYRVVKAVAEVGTLYEKERRIRMLPKHHKEALERSGLSAEAFEKAWVAAREAKYLGKNGVNEAGLDLLAAVEAMNADA